MNKSGPPGFPVRVYDWGEGHPYLLPVPDWQRVNLPSLWGPGFMEGLYNLTNHGVRKAEAPWWCTLWWTNIALEMKSCYYIGKSSINNRCFIVMVYCRSQLRLPAIHRCNVLASRPPTKLLRLRLRKGCRKNGDFTSSLSNRDMNAVDRYKNYSIPYTSSYIYIYKPNVNGLVFLTNLHRKPWLLPQKSSAGRPKMFHFWRVIVGGWIVSTIGLLIQCWYHSSGFSHQKWWFSIVMLVYQRVPFFGNPE